MLTVSLAARHCHRHCQSDITPHLNWATLGSIPQHFRLALPNPFILRSHRFSLLSERGLCLWWSSGVYCSQCSLPRSHGLMGGGGESEGHRECDSRMLLQHYHELMHPVLCSLSLPVPGLVSRSVSREIVTLCHAAHHNHKIISGHRNHLSVFHSWFLCSFLAHKIICTHCLLLSSPDF